MAMNFGLADTNAPERMVTNALAAGRMGEQDQRNALLFQNQQEDRLTNNALRTEAADLARQKHQASLLPLIGQAMYADPSNDGLIDMLAGTWTKATGQDVSQFGANLKMMPPDQRREVARQMMGQRAGNNIKTLNLGTHYQAARETDEGLVPLGQPVPITKPDMDSSPRINNPTIVKGKDGLSRFWNGTKWEVVTDDNGQPFLSARENPESRQDLSAADAAGKATVARQEDSAKSEKKIGSLTEALKSARDILRTVKDDGTVQENSTVTASGAGAIADKVTDFVGVGTESKANAGKLELVSGWMTANVPRMEGPQSDYDVQNYKIMAGQVGDRTIPVTTRLAMLDELEKLQKKYAHLNKQYAERKPVATGKIQFLGFE